MAKAYSTIGTILKFGAGTGSSVTTAQLCPIKSFPALGGAPDQIESTDLENTMQTFVAGVQSIDTMEFTANYTKSTYAAVEASAGTPGYYCVEFGESGADGKFSWQGTHTVYKNGEGVDAVREMTIVCSPSTAITFA